MESVSSRHGLLLNMCFFRWHLNTDTTIGKRWLLGKLLSHTRGFLSRMEYECQNKKKKIWGVLLDPSDSSISFIQPLFVVSITVLRCLFRSLLCHACLNLHYILTSAERRDFSNPIAFLELLFDKSNQSQSSFLDCWPMVSGCWAE